MELQRSVMRWKKLRDKGGEFCIFLFLACTFKNIMGGSSHLSLILWNTINLELRSDRTILPILIKDLYPHCWCSKQKKLASDMR